jgi:hypothetical protein
VAHGSRYCDLDNFQEEEPKLEPLVQQIAGDGYYFVGLGVGTKADRSFSEMIVGAGGRSSITESFTPEQGNEVLRIGETMRTMTLSAVVAALWP